jgi:hypothetical protein
MSNEEIKQKIEQICEELGIEIVWFKTGKSCANRQKKSVRVKEIGDSGDFAVALHEIGHTQCDPQNKPANPGEVLDAETNAWTWALERNGGNFDAEGWKRLHESLLEYYHCVMDTSHPALQLLMEAVRQNDAIRPQGSSFAVKINFGRKKKTTL